MSSFPACAEFSRVLDEIWVREHLSETYNHEPGVQFVPNLLQYSAAFQRCVSDPVVLAAVRVALGPAIRLNRILGRRADPGHGHQALHDLERSRGGPYFKANAIWCLDEFTPFNGSTRLIPGSHANGEPYLSRLVDPGLEHPDERRALAPRGSVIVHNSHILHGGTRNDSQSPRRSIHAAFSTLNVEPHWTFGALPPGIRAALTPETLALLEPAMPPSTARWSPGAPSVGL
jgi:ectoine hydroxylase-related dioxygenase (phytanoyl-CoA dioxygenase family)